MAIRVWDNGNGWGDQMYDEEIFRENLEQILNDQINDQMFFYNLGQRERSNHGTTIDNLRRERERESERRRSVRTMKRNEERLESLARRQQDRMDRPRRANRQGRRNLAQLAQQQVQEELNQLQERRRVMNEKISAVTSALEESGLTYRIERNGMIFLDTYGVLEQYRASIRDIHVHVFNRNGVWEPGYRIIFNNGWGIYYENDYFDVRPPRGNILYPPWAKRDRGGQRTDQINRSLPQLGWWLMSNIPNVNLGGGNEAEELLNWNFIAQWIEERYSESYQSMQDIRGRGRRKTRKRNKRKRRKSNTKRKRRRRKSNTKRKRRRRKSNTKRKRKRRKSNTKRKLKRNQKRKTKRKTN